VTSLVDNPLLCDANDTNTYTLYYWINDKICHRQTLLFCGITGIMPKFCDVIGKHFHFVILLVETAKLCDRTGILAF
jgi:hypothetical protein